MIDQQHTLEVLAGVTSVDAGVRKAAEGAIEQWAVRDLSELVCALLTVARDSSDGCERVALRELGVIILRRVLLDKEGVEGRKEYFCLDDASKVRLRDDLCSAVLGGETNGKIKKHLCELMCRLATEDSVSGNWQQVLPLANQLVTSPNATDNENGFRMLEWLTEGSEYVEILLSPSSNAHFISTMRRGLRACEMANTADNGHVAIAAISCLTALLLRGACSGSHVVELRVLVDDVAACLQMLMSHSSPDQGSAEVQTTGDFIACMIDIAGLKPSFFAGTKLEPMLILSMQLIHASTSSSGSSESQRQLIEFVVTMCESRPKEVKKIKTADGQGLIVSCFLPMLAAMMALIPDSYGTWEAGDDGSSDEDDGEAFDGPTIAEEAYDRICQALGARITFAAVMSQLKAFLSGGDAATSSWQHRYAGLILMANYLDLLSSAKSLFKSQVERSRHQDEVVRQMLHSCSDPVPRCRFAAFFGITQLIVVQGSTLSEEHLEALLNVIIAGISAATNPPAKVRSYALSALINVLDLLPESSLEARSGMILHETVAAMSAGPILIQEHCLSVIISLARVVNKQSLAPLYEAIAPILKQLISYAHANALISLWGQAMDCFAIVGEASGRDKFRDDALSLMQTLVHVHDTLPSEAHTHLLRVWTRIAPCLGADFLPYMSLVVSNIVKLLEVDITSGTGDVDLDDPAMEERSDIDVLETDDGYLVIRTSAAEDQASACQLMKLLMKGVGESFLPCLEQATRALLPLIKSPHYDVRIYALEAMPELIKCAAKGSREVSLAPLLDYLLPHVTEQINRESALEHQSRGLEILRDMVCHASTNWAMEHAYEVKDDELDLTPSNSLAALSHAHMLEINKCALMTLQDSIQRRAVLRAQAQVSGGKDEDDEDDEREYLEMSLERHHLISQLVGSLLCTHGPLFMPVYKEQWHHILLDLVQPHCLKEDRVIGVSIACDVVLHGGLTDASDETNLFVTEILVPTVECCSSGQSAELRRMAAFTVGIAAERYPQSFAPLVLTALAALNSCIVAGDSEENEGGGGRGNASDNAVSSVGIIVDSHEPLLVASGIDCSQLWGQWLAYQPLRSDLEESQKVTKQLCVLLEQRRESLFCSTQRVTAAVSVLLQVCTDHNLTSEALSQRILQALRGLSAVQDEQQWQQMKAAIDPTLAQHLSSLR